MTSHTIKRQTTSGHLDFQIRLTVRQRTRLREPRPIKPETKEGCKLIVTASQGFMGALFRSAWGLKMRKFVAVLLILSGCAQNPSPPVR